VMEKHAHSEIEITVVIEGRGTFEFEAQEYIIEKGSVVIIPADVAHLYTSSRNICFGVLHTGELTDVSARLFAQLAPHGQPRVLSLSALDLEQYIAIFRSWLKVISQPLQDRTRTILSWVEIFILFMRDFAHQSPSFISISRAAHYIKTNLQSEILIGELAGQASLSVSSFRAVFKAAYGLSPKQYQQQCRITESKWLLRTTDLPVQQIAEQLGFRSLHAFSHWFLSNEEEGYSPKKWRDMQQG
jgi:AraC family transcriptional regulator